MSDWKYDKLLEQYAQSLEPTEKDLSTLMHRKRQKKLYYQYLMPALLPVLTIALIPFFINKPIDQTFNGSIDLNLEHVTINGNGQGEISGKDNQLTIAWNIGQISVEVEPEKGVNLSIQTPDALVNVIGTKFTVDCSEKGTALSVEQGKVEFICHNLESNSIASKQSDICYKSAGTALVQARDFLDEGLATLAIEATNKGLSLEPGEAVKEELNAVKILAFSSIDEEQALPLAKSYLQSKSQLRRDEILSITSRLALKYEGCAEAEPFLQEYATLPSASPVALVKLSDCLIELKKPGSLDLLERALQSHLTPEEQADIIRRIELTR